MNRCPVCALPVKEVTSIETDWNSYRCFADCTPQTLMTQKSHPHTSKIVPDVEALNWHPMRSNPLDFRGLDAPKLVDARGRKVIIQWVFPDYWVQFGDEEPVYGGGCTATCYLLNVTGVGLVGKEMRV